MYRLINFIKKYKYKILLLILYILFFLQMQNVYMYGDDYTFYIDNYKSIDNIINRFIFNYNSFSGRLIGHGILSIGFSLFGINFFRVLNPIFLFLFCYFLTKIININKKYDNSKLMFIITIIILGLDLVIVREFLYFAGAAVLYLWGFVPLLIIIYYILFYNCYKKNMSNKLLFALVLLVTIINFIMETTSIFLISFLILFLLNVFIKERKLDKKILFLLIYSIMLIIFSYFIPGNLERISLNNKIDNNFFTIFLLNLPNYFNHLFYNEGFGKYLFVFSMLLLIACRNNHYYNKKINIFCCIYVLLFNIFLFINECFLLVNFYLINFKIVLYIFFVLLLIYFIINSYLLYINFYKKNDLLFLLFLASVLTTIVPIILINYVSIRFFFIFILYIISILLYVYINYDDMRIYIILFSLLVFNVYIGLFCIVIYYFVQKMKKYNLVYRLNFIFNFIFCLFNLFSFFKTMYYYNENSKIFDYNISVLNKIDHNVSGKTIILKKIKYSDYAVLMPEDSLLYEEWYKDYYNIEKYLIIWE